MWLLVLSLLLNEVFWSVLAVQTLVPGRGSRKSCPRLVLIAATAKVLEVISVKPTNPIYTFGSPYRVQAREVLLTWGCPRRVCWKGVPVRKCHKASLHFPVLLFHAF